MTLSLDLVEELWLRLRHYTIPIAPQEHVYKDVHDQPLGPFNSLFGWPSSSEAVYAKCAGHKAIKG